MEFTIINYWPVILSFVSLIVWLVRLEAGLGELKRIQVESNKRISDLESQHQMMEQMALDIREIKTNIDWLLGNKKKNI